MKGNVTRARIAILWESLGKRRRDQRRRDQRRRGRVQRRRRGINCGKQVVDLSVGSRQG